MAENISFVDFLRKRPCQHLREDSEQRQRTSHKLQLCPEKYLPIVEGVIDGAIKLKDADDEKEDV